LDLPSRGDPSVGPQAIDRGTIIIDQTGCCDMIKKEILPASGGYWMSSGGDNSKSVSHSLQETIRHLELIESIKPGSPEARLLQAHANIHWQAARVVNFRQAWRYAAYVTAGGLAGALSSYVLGWTPSMRDIASRSLHLTGSIMTGGGTLFTKVGDFVDAVGNYVPPYVAGPVAGITLVIMLVVVYRVAKSLNFVAPAIILGTSWSLLGPILGASTALTIGVGGAAGHYAHVVSRDYQSTRKAMRDAKIVGKAILNPRRAWREGRIRKHVRERHAAALRKLGAG
jgi:hypothetical protein